VKAPGAVVPPLMALTTMMPADSVCAPGPPALRTSSLEVPVALPPSITSMSDGDPSAPR